MSTINEYSDNLEDSIDLEKFVELFDSAISSKNPAVQRALRNLLMISTLADAAVSRADYHPVGGPLRELVIQSNKNAVRLNALEAAMLGNGIVPNTFIGGSMAYNGGGGGGAWLRNKAASKAEPIAYPIGGIAPAVATVAGADGINYILSAQSK